MQLGLAKSNSSTVRGSAAKNWMASSDSGGVYGGCSVTETCRLRSFEVKGEGLRSMERRKGGVLGNGL